MEEPKNEPKVEFCEEVYQFDDENLYSLEDDFDNSLAKTRSRAWVFTFNNYMNYRNLDYENSDENDWVRFFIDSELDKKRNDASLKKNLGYKFLMFSIETAPSTGTRHIQGYIYFKNPKEFSALKKIFPQKMYFAKSLCDYKTNYKYISGLHPKKGNVLNNTFESYGEPPKYAVKELTVRNLVSSIREGQSLSQIIMNNSEHINLQRSGVLKNIEMLKTIYSEGRSLNDTTRVYIAYGSSGSGKSYWSKEYANTISNGDYYIWNTSNSKWCPGYDGQKVVIIDEFRDSFCSYRDLLMILSNEPYYVESKGRSMPFNANTIIITTYINPLKLYRNVQEAKTQFYRRIDGVIYFNNLQTKTCMLDKPKGSPKDPIYIKNYRDNMNKFLEFCMQNDVSLDPDSLDVQINNKVNSFLNKDNFSKVNFDSDFEE